MNSKKILSNFIWRFLERSGAQGVSVIVSVVLARLLDPEVYGTVAIVTVFLTIMQVLVDSGLGTALIQKKDADEVDFSTVFWFNLLMGPLLYIIMFFLAPLISAFFKMPELSSLLRVASLFLIVSGIKNVQQAYVSRNMMFRHFFFATLAGTIGAAIMGITMAYLGYGVWALVFQMLFNTIVDTTILWITVRWRPQRLFSIQRLKTLFSYGWKLLISALLDTIYNEMRQVIIGKVYTRADLAQYNQGEKFPKLIVTNINTSIDSVLLPTMSKAQDNPATVKSMTRRAIKTSTFIIVPFMTGLFVCAKPLISVLLTDKWIPCVPFLRIFCVSFAMYPIHTANLNAIKALGRSDLFLKLEIMKKAIGLFALFTTVWISVKAMAYSLLVTSILSQFINAWPNKKLMDYSYLEQMKDLSKQLLLSAFMGLVVYCISFIGLKDVYTLGIQIVVGIVIYLFGSKIMRIDSLEYLLGILKNNSLRKKN